MIPRVGNSASDIPIETQMLLLEAKEDSSSNDSKGSPSYVIFMPTLDGEFRSSLQGNSADELEVCIESGENLSDMVQLFHVQASHSMNHYKK